jgi:hypothetical protein
MSSETESELDRKDGGRRDRCRVRQKCSRVGHFCMYCMCGGDALSNQRRRGRRMDGQYLAAQLTLGHCTPDWASDFASAACGASRSFAFYSRGREGGRWVSISSR